MTYSCIQQILRNPNTYIHACMCVHAHTHTHTIRTNKQFQQSHGTQGQYSKKNSIVFLNAISKHLN